MISRSRGHTVSQSRFQFTVCCLTSRLISRSGNRFSKNQPTFQAHLFHVRNYCNIKLAEIWVKTCQMRRPFWVLSCTTSAVYTLLQYMFSSVVQISTPLPGALVRGLKPPKTLTIRFKWRNQIPSTPIVTSVSLCSRTSSKIGSTVSSPPSVCDLQFKQDLKISAAGYKVTNGSRV